MSAATDDPDRQVLVVGGVDADALGEGGVDADALGDDVHLVGDGDRAVERATDGDVRCVVVGHDPPRVDAPDVVAAVAESTSVPVVLCGPVDDAVLADAVAAGVDEYVPRPREGVADAVARAVGREGAAVGERDREVLERVSDGFVALDPSFRVQYANEAAAEMLDASREALVGAVLWDQFPGAVGSAFEREYRAAMAAGESTAFEEYFPPLGAWFEVRAYPSETGLSVYFRDVTERKVNETKRAARRRQFGAVLDSPVTPVVMLHADGTVFNANEAALDAVDADLDAVDGTRFWETPWVPESDAASMREAVASAIDGERTRFETPFGTGGDRTVDLSVSPVTDERDAVVGVLVAGRDITERVRYAREVERNRAQLAAVTRVASVARDVNQALDELGGRGELEEFVCDRFVEGTGFDLAWVGRIDAVGDALTPTAAAGGAAERLDGVRVGVDDDPDGPVARAVETRSMQIAREVGDAPEFEPWRAASEEGDLGACAAIPITYGDTLYGVLVVYAPDAAAVDGAVRPMLRQFDTVLGHALAAASRRLALTGDQHVELTFDVSSSFLTDAAAAAGGRVSLVGRVSPVEGRTVRYLSVSGDAEAVASLAAERGRDARVVSDGDEGVVEVVGGDAVGRELASHGLVVEEYAADVGGAVLTVRHPTETETRAAVEAVTARLPSASLRAQRETSPSAEPPGRERHLLSSALTDRQRTALETAYYAGYFEWPRGTTGEELAELMGVAGPTFHQHLRAAHRKLLARLVE